MFKFSSFFKLFRFEQWYKNIVVFIPLIFSFNLFKPEFILLTFLSFLSLCFVSSSYYIINDIKDIKKDKHHPEKSKRPIASGKMDILSASFISILLLMLSLLIGLFLPLSFIFSIIILFALSILYTFYIRNIAFMDIILISVNFVIRAIAGTFAIGYGLSYWVILCTFFVALFLVSVKRSAEISLENFKKYRPNFDVSDKKVLDFVAILSATCIFVFFSIYSILFDKTGLLFSLPFALYITFMFFHDLYRNPVNVRNPEKFVFKKSIILSFILWFIALVIGLYFF